jgi:hypothetical protein
MIPKPPNVPISARDGNTTPDWYTWFLAIWTRTGSFSGNLAPNNAKYITQTPSIDLTAEQALSLLSSGYAKITTGSGVISTTATLPTSDLNGIVASSNGGTGINNGSSTITIGGNTTFSGAFDFTGNVTGSTNITFPTSGTLSTTTGTITSVTFTGDGTVLSSTPSSAVTSSGTLTATLNNQNANVVLAGPTSGSAAAPTFRSLVVQDILNASQSVNTVSYSYFGGM